MGLNITYGAFDAPYSEFMKFRIEIAKRVGIPLRLMEGFYCDDIEWDVYKPSPLHELLRHSDCDGHISLNSLRKLVPELEKILDKDEDSEFQETLETFIDGAKDAINDGSSLEFM
jgi:hypothetical protein